MGIALSKYSLTFPGLFYFFHKRWYRGLALSLGIQLAGLLAIAAIGRTPPLAVLGEYVQMMLKHTDMPGQHLTATLLNGWGSIAPAIVGLLSIGLFLALIYWYRTYHSGELRDNQTAATTFLVALIQWNLLVLPHRRYDHVAEILFIALVILRTRGEGRRFLLSDWQSKGLLALVGLAISVWSLPLYYLLGTTLYAQVFTFLSLVALGISVWLLFKVPDHVQGQMLSLGGGYE